MEQKLDTEIETVNGVVRKVKSTKRNFSCVEEADGTLWIIDSSGAAFRIKLDGLTGNEVD